MSFLPQRERLSPASVQRALFARLLAPSRRHSRQGRQLRALRARLLAGEERNAPAAELHTTPRIILGVEVNKGAGASEAGKPVRLDSGPDLEMSLNTLRVSSAMAARAVYQFDLADGVSAPGAFEARLARLTRAARSAGAARIVVVSDCPRIRRSGALAPMTALRSRRAAARLPAKLVHGQGVSVIIYDRRERPQKGRARRHHALRELRFSIAERMAGPAGSTASPAVAVGDNEDALAFLSARGQAQRPVLPDMSRVLASPPEAGTASADKRPWNMLISSVGEHAPVADILTAAAQADGLAVIHAESGIPGQSVLRLARKAGQLRIPWIGAGAADMLLGAGDFAGSLRMAAWSPARTCTLLNVRDCGDSGSGRSVRRLQADFSALAEAVTGNETGSVPMMLGAAWQAGWLPLSLTSLEQAIAASSPDAGASRKALAWGRIFAARPEYVHNLTGAAGSASVSAAGILPDIGASLHEHIRAGARHLKRYQGRKLAGQYRRRLAVFAAELENRPLDSGMYDQLTRYAAMNYAALLAFSDAYEIARQLTAPEVEAQIHQQLRGRVRRRFFLSRQLFSGKAPREGKRSYRKFGRWMAAPLRLLALGRKIRGTGLDPLRWRRQHRIDRSLIASYEEVLDEIGATVHHGNAATALDLIRLPELVRGFGAERAPSLEHVGERAEHLWGEYARSAEISASAPREDQPDTAGEATGAALAA